MIAKAKEIVKYSRNTVYAIINYFTFLASFKTTIKRAEIVFFFPYYHTGGAERVHVDILKALPHKKCVVIFTHNSATHNFYGSFAEMATVFEINPILNKKIPWINDRLFKTIVSSINGSPGIETVFGCNTSYFYKVIPKLKPEIRIADLFHAFAENDTRIPEVVQSAPIVNQRIVINQKAKNDITAFYRHYTIDECLTNRITVIPNGIVINKNNLPQRNKGKIRIGFIGRWSEEKRPGLFLQVARKLQDSDARFSFLMAGTGMRSNSDKIEQAGVEFLGEITDTNILNTLYSELDFLIITSVYEGFPMVIMEAMNFGVVPIATDVGGIGEHIAHNENGILIDQTHPDAIVAAITHAILEICSNPQQKEQLSRNAYAYATAHFNIENFNAAYQTLFNTKA